MGEIISPAPRELSGDSLRMSILEIDLYRHLPGLDFNKHGAGDRETEAVAALAGEGVG
jgi:hypothetical protein